MTAFCGDGTGAGGGAGAAGLCADFLGVVAGGRWGDAAGEGRAGGGRGEDTARGRCRGCTGEGGASSRAGAVAAGGRSRTRVEEAGSVRDGAGDFFGEERRLEPLIWSSSKYRRFFLRVLCG